MKNTYLEPMIEVVKFSVEDILLASEEPTPTRTRSSMEIPEFELD